MYNVLEINHVVWMSIPFKFVSTGHLTMFIGGVFLSYCESSILYCIESWAECIFTDLSNSASWLVPVRNALDDVHRPQSLSCVAQRPLVVYLMLGCSFCTSKMKCWSESEPFICNSCLYRSKNIIWHPTPNVTKDVQKVHFCSEVSSRTGNCLLS